MKRYCSKLSVMLVMISAVGFAQTPAPPATPLNQRTRRQHLQLGNRSQRRRRLRLRRGRTPLPLRLPLRRSTNPPASASTAPAGTPPLLLGIQVGRLIRRGTSLGRKIRCR